MDVYECIKKRRSIRKFLKKEVDWEKISLILDAGRLAPSAGNLQNWKFIVVLDEGKRKSVAEACVKQSWIEGAPFMIVIVGEPQSAERFYGKRGSDLYTAQNCAAAAENMLLMATSLGLQGCWVGAFSEDMIKRIFGIPNYAEPFVILPFGYPDSEGEEPAKFPIEHVTYFNGWRGKIENPAAYMGYYSPGLQKRLKKGKAAAEKGAKKLAEKGKEIAESIKKKIKKD